jgi:hypothetical protein
MSPRHAEREHDHRSVPQSVISGTPYLLGSKRSSGRLLKVRVQRAEPVPQDGRRHRLAPGPPVVHLWELATRVVATSHGSRTWVALSARAVEALQRQRRRQRRQQIAARNYENLDLVFARPDG